MEHYFQIKQVEKKKPKEKIDSPNQFWCQNANFLKLNDFIINKSIAEKLENIVLKSSTDNKNIINLFIHGSHGCGKYTLARYYTYLYTDIENPCLNLETLKYESKELEYYRGSKHVELVIYKYNFSDVNIIHKFFETVCHSSVDYKVMNKKIIIIKNIENIRRENIYLVKHYLEKFSTSNAFILISSGSMPRDFLGFLTKIRVSLPEEDELLTLAKKVTKSQKIKSKKSDLKKIVKQSGRNIQKLINLLELSYISGNYTEVSETDDYNFIFLYNLIKRKSIMSVFKIRELLVDLLTENVTSQQILKFLINRFIKSKNITHKQKEEIIKILVNADKMDSQSLRNVIHLEYACLQIMNLFD